MKKLLVFCLAWLALLANAHEEHTMQQKDTLAISAAFDAQGNLWRASVKDDFVLVDKSND